ncbi:MAG: type II toxin-antitoxin system RelE/ParE family toxin [Halieaceae bacterium]|jgi:hypothetical protein|nr:type II toxin-antitoxin system RelE/ParE family toxin [Halieaceae bacterium]
MKATFKELSPFESRRADYLTDEQYRLFQIMLMKNPEMGSPIAGTGGLRKVRYGDQRRGKGKRGGLRTIYYWQEDEATFWLFLIYDKDEMDDLTSEEKRELKRLLKEALAGG